MAKVYVGVGHGGVDSGAVGNGLKEKDIALAISLACQAELGRHKVETLISRTTDVTFPVKQKVPQCNEYKPDLALDIHINAAGGKGAEVWYYKGGGQSQVLAQNILNSILTHTSEKTNRGIKPDTTNAFGMIGSIKAPSVLVECAFIDSADVQNVDTLTEQITMGKAIAWGILHTLGIPVLPEAPVAVPPTKLYKVQVGAFGVKSNAEALANKLRAQGYQPIIVEG